MKIREGLLGERLFKPFLFPCLFHDLKLLFTLVAAGKRIHIQVLNLSFHLHRVNYNFGIDSGE